MLLKDCYIDHNSLKIYVIGHMTTQPDDSGKLTTIGRFAAQLPLDLSLARLVIMGITLGVAREAVVLAGALSQPKSVFRLASPLIHKDPNEYNEIVKSTFLSMVKIDNGMYSEPLMMLRLFLMWRNMKVDERQSKLTKLGIAHVRMRQFSSCCINLLERVNHTNRMNLSYDGMSEESLDHQLTKLRLILLWTSDSNLIRMKPSIKMDENLVIKVSSPTLTDDHLRLMFPSEIKYTCQKLGKRIFDAALSKRRLETSREVWLRELLQMSYAGGVRICWIVDNGKQLKVEDEKSDDKIHTNDSHVSSVDEAIRVSPSHILFAVCCSDPTKSETSLEQAHYSYEKAVLSLKSTFGASKLQFLSQCSFISGGKEMFFHVFIIEHPSKKMIKSVKDLHDLYDYSVSLSIVNAVSAHLTAANISLNQDQLANFFFKLDELDDGCNQWHMDEQTENRKIAEQVLHSQQIISFEEPDATETSGNISIRDIPLGLRLYKAYCAGYRDR